MNRLTVTIGALALFLLSPLHAQEWHTGLCQGRVDATLSFPVGGVIAQILKKEGEPVRRDDVILELESSLESLEVARQSLAVEAAQKDFERTKKVLANGGSVTQEEVEQKEAVWKIAQVERQQAEEQLKRRQLRASADGIVDDLFDLERGEAIAANTPAAHVLDITECRFTAYVKGDIAHGFKKDSEVEIVFNSGDQQVTVTGKVEYVSKAVDAASGLQEVRAVFDNKDEGVRSGWQGKMRLKPAK